jgi:CBS domain-containing protein
LWHELCPTVAWIQVAHLDLLCVINTPFVEVAAMKVLEKPLHSLTAEDLMTENVITVPTGMSLRGAAALFRREQVSGAPVVDPLGRCVGVLSTSDFLKLAGGPLRKGRSDCVCCEWQVMEPNSVPEELVERYMTPNPVTVPTDMRLPELARRMLDAHIHRVIVVDDEMHPVGIVSTLDVMAAVAHMPFPTEG